MAGLGHAGATSLEIKVSVDPSEVNVKVGDVFEVYVNISNVSNLQGFDFMLAYNAGILNCLTLHEGNLLNSFGDTFIAKQEINASFGSTVGRIWLAAAILGKGYANGSGTLAMIRFNATAVGESVLDLYSDYPYRPDEVKLTTCGSQVIQNVAVDGHVIVASRSNGSGITGGDPQDPSRDVNGDGVVGIQDITLIALAHGALVGDKRYDARLDLDQNGVIDIRDISMCAREFGKNV
jgi:hypothetical protein